MGDKRPQLSLVATVRHYYQLRTETFPYESHVLHPADKLMRPFYLWHNNIYTHKAGFMYVYIVYALVLVPVRYTGKVDTVT